MLDILNLFSKNGELGLQLERDKGFKTVAYCEPDENYRKVLELVWPQAQAFASVADVLASPPSFDCLAVTITDTDLGFAANHKYIDYFNAVRDLKPRWVISEHKKILERDGLEQLVSMFTSLDYFADWYTPDDGYYKCAGFVNTQSTWIVAEPKAQLVARYQAPILDLVRYRIERNPITIPIPRRISGPIALHPPIPQIIADTIVYRKT